ncbi:SDR family oxidoreductase [Chitinophaga pinensis]|uniref:SDR family oxidoreductase n=1 Tax=Chitinophaga pinensis TaxID=79329 RepID=UPI0021BD1FCC|nr:SDR family oxidoreductase [Chitinophaga pinensis]
MNVLFKGYTFSHNRRFHTFGMVVLSLICPADGTIWCTRLFRICIYEAAVETLSRYQAKELGARRIRVNAIAPGPTATDFGGGIVKDNVQFRANVTALTALGRVGEPDDIGGVVAFLCTDAARWVTAQRIEVSGGMNI